MDPRMPQWGCPELGIDQDLTYHRKEWMVQKIVWGGFTLLVMAALLGLLGDGPLSRTSLTSRDKGLMLEYDRFGRKDAPTLLRFHFTEPADAEKYFRLWIDSEYLEGNRVEEISPPPERVDTEAPRLVYVFRTRQSGQPAEVTFYLRPRRAGRQDGRVGLEWDRDAAIRFHQFIYP